MLAALRRIDRLLTWKRAVVYAVPVIGLYLAGSAYSFIGSQPPLNGLGIQIGGDYIAFHTAGQLLRTGHGADLYDQSTVVGAQDALLHGAIPGFYNAFRNPPFFALPFASLSLLDLVSSYVIWTLVSVALLALALKLLLEDIPELKSKWRGLLILVFAFAPIFIGLLDGQNATLSLLLYVLIYRSLIRGHDRRLGMYAALGLFKPQLFIVFPFILLATRRWRALAAYAATAAALVLLSLAVVGPHGSIGWLRILIDMEQGNAAANAWRMHSLKAFFDLLLPGQSVASLIVYGLSAAALLGCLAWVWSRSSIAADHRRLWALTSIVAVLIDPHIVEYDLAVLIPAGIFLVLLHPALRWTIVAFYPLALIQVSPVLGAVLLQFTVLILLWWAAVLARDVYRLIKANDASAARLILLPAVNRRS